MREGIAASPRARAPRGSGRTRYSSRHGVMFRADTLIDSAKAGLVVRVGSGQHRLGVVDYVLWTDAVELPDARGGVGWARRAVRPEVIHPHHARRGLGQLSELILPFRGPFLLRSGLGDVAANGHDMRPLAMPDQLRGRLQRSPVSLRRHAPASEGAPSPRPAPGSTSAGTLLHLPVSSLEELRRNPPGRGARPMDSRRCTGR